MIQLDGKYDFDMCALEMKGDAPQVSSGKHPTAYSFLCEGMQFFLKLTPEGDSVIGEVSAQITYLPFTAEDVERRLFFLNLLNMLSIKMGAPFMIQNERYVFFKKSFEIKGDADMSRVMYNTYNIVLAYLPYMKIFKS